jgi:hypothetical protein
MTRLEIIFGALCIGGIALSIWNGAKARQRVARYSPLRRGTGLGFEEKAALRTRLNKMTPDMSWTATTLVQVQPAPRGNRAECIFSASSRAAPAAEAVPYGYACFGERVFSQPGKAVEIDPRVPLLSNMLDNRVETGRSEFRHEYSVASRDPAVAQGAVNPEVQRILLDHFASQKWS